MKTKAAIAYAAGKPLEVVTVDLDGPKAGELDRAILRTRASRSAVVTF
jgi:Zn-dependent alcohol dehydrogenase